MTQEFAIRNKVGCGFYCGNCEFFNAIQPDKINGVCFNPDSNMAKCGVHTDYACELHTFQKKSEKRRGGK